MSVQVSPEFKDQLLALAETWRLLIPKCVETETKVTLGNCAASLKDMLDDAEEGDMQSAVEESDQVPEQA